MTREDIIRMAREAGFEIKVLNSIDGDEVLCFDPIITDTLKDFAALVAAAEREACAKVCEDKHHTWRWDDEADSASGPRDCAAAIRARGQHDH